MKIIFDSEKQKDDFMELMKANCPSDLDNNLRELQGEECKYPDTCSKCWSNCGIEMEIKKDE